MASWSCVLLQVNVLTSQQLHFGFNINFDFICHFEFTLLGLTINALKIIVPLAFVGEFTGEGWQQHYLIAGDDPRKWEQSKC
jgi:hypothetical protein